MAHEHHHIAWEDDPGRLSGHPDDSLGYKLRLCLKKIKKIVKETKPQRVWTGSRPLNSGKHAPGTGFRQEETMALSVRTLGTWAGVAMEVEGRRTWLKALGGLSAGDASNITVGKGSINMRALCPESPSAKLAV